MGDEATPTQQNIARTLAHGRSLLRTTPAMAARQAREILVALPKQAPAQPRAQALRLLGAAERALGHHNAAREAEMAAIAAATRDPMLVRAGKALVDNDIPVAEQLVRTRLKEDPYDTAAIRMFAEVAARIGRLVDSENLLRRALELAPDFTAARANLATVLYRQNRAVEALEVLDALADDDGFALAKRNLKAAALSRVGGYDEAIALYRDVLTRIPDQPKVWMSLGHLLKTVGQQEEAIAAYREAVALQPSFGEAWWSLANLKTVRFSTDDIAAMRAALDDEGVGEEDRLHLHFSLGKAAEDGKKSEEAWAHYETANRMRARQLQHDAGRVTRGVDRAIDLFTADFFAERAGWGDPSPDPIFILGMPRAGSTLVEQMLASHPEVEGTMELPDIITLARELAGGHGQEADSDRYPARLSDLTREEVAALGATYLERTRVHRREGNPFFIDKMPNNWMHVGLIALILPNATIIDARRHPLACGFSNFKQHFARGQSFAYSLEDFGHYFADYARLMAHVDEVLPGRVHRLIHERLVDDPEAELRALLDHCGLAFDERCLRFWETERAVRTASSEQVRQPISRKGLDAWRAHEAHLGPLEDALGHWLDDWID